MSARSHQQAGRKNASTEVSHSSPPAQPLQQVIPQEQPQKVSKEGPLQEVLDIVLPGLVYERWSFDANDPTDREMGEDIWRKVRSNFRKLSSLIDTANIVAIAQNQVKITLPLLQTVYTEFMAPEDWSYMHPSKPSPEADTPAGPHEDISQQRHQAKEQKDKRGNADAK